MDRPTAKGACIRGNWNTRSTCSPNVSNKDANRTASAFVSPQNGRRAFAKAQRTIHTRVTPVKIHDPSPVPTRYSEKTSRARVPKHESSELIDLKNVFSVDFNRFLASQRCCPSAKNKFGETSPLILASGCGASCKAGVHRISSAALAAMLDPDNRLRCAHKDVA